ncbi:hypothetical protein K1J40_10165 [Enterobacter roggenkampii]|uniref:hypothetical protein n=1 Tax=Enterobacter roggenkampii TaxID=1812935 RepID=UPI001C654927|nr:hypothetical protein [Enterobacter roggenkampii]MBW7749366.1 hypothetical protein [Enterobacter roggenkampii]
MSRTANINTALFAVTESFLPPSASIVETQEGYDVVEIATRFERGDTLLIWYCGRQLHAHWAGGALITDDGEAIEGEALDEVRLVGVVTHTIHPVSSEENPFM